MPKPANHHKTLQEVRSRIRFRPAPKGFDPLKATMADLVQFGVPPQPNRAAAPERHAFWSKFFSGPLNFVQPEFDLFDDPEPHHIAPQHQRSPGGSRREKSLNWSGVYIRPSAARMFTEIHGEWVVPKPSPPKSVGMQKAIPGKYRSVSFIGLDGQRRYRNSSLPQIGTASHIHIDAAGNVKKESTYAWWQWWVRDHSQREARITSVPIRPFDVVLCSLVVISPTTVRFFLKNQTTGYVFGPVDYQAPTPEDSSQLKVTGATAEWITERPAAFDAKHTLYELPNYDEVKFSNCYAVSSSPHFVEQTEKLSLATVINMRAIRQQPHRSVPISIAEITGEQSFTTRYVK